MRERLRVGLGERVMLHGPLESRLLNTLNVSIDGVRGQELLAGIPELAASTGSACHSGRPSPSPVLTAMGLPAERSLSALRLSLGRWSTEEEIDRATELIISAAAVSGRGGRRREVRRA